MQTITITIEFEVEHVPNNEAHLHEVARRYLEGKGVVLVDGKIRV